MYLNYFMAVKNLIMATAIDEEFKKSVQFHSKFYKKEFYLNFIFLLYFMGIK